MLRGEGDGGIMKTRKEWDFCDFAAAGSSVRKTCWILRLYGMIVNSCMAISYGDFGRNKPDTGALAERSGNKGLD